MEYEDEEEFIVNKKRKYYRFKPGDEVNIYYNNKYQYGIISNILNNNKYLIYNKTFPDILLMKIK